MTTRPHSLLPRRVAMLVCVAVGLAGLAGCSDDGDATAVQAQVTTPSASASVSCPDPQATTTPGAQRTVMSGRETRTYNVWLPVGYTGTKPVPLVVDFHGTGGDPVSYESAFSSMGSQAPARGYLLVAPQAIAGDAAGIGWKSPGSGTTPDDVQFTADLLTDVAKNYCVDQSRKYATGFSSGAAFTTYLGCRLDTWAAIAPMAGLNLVQPCVSRPPVPIITFHGKADTYVPYSSNAPASLADPNTFYLGDVPTVIEQFAARNGCDPDPIDTPVVATVTKRTFAGCTADVTLYTIDDAGHTYPGGKPVSVDTAEELGGQSQAIDAGKVLLDYFDVHQRSTPPVDVPARWIPSAAPAAPTPTITVTVP